MTRPPSPYPVRILRLQLHKTVVEEAAAFLHPAFARPSRRLPHSHSRKRVVRVLCWCRCGDCPLAEVSRAMPLTTRRRRRRHQNQNPWQRPPTHPPIPGSIDYAKYSGEVATRLESRTKFDSHRVTRSSSTTRSARTLPHLVSLIDSPVTTEVDYDGSWGTSLRARPFGEPHETSFTPNGRTVPAQA